jgi:hypothetical protein
VNLTEELHAKWCFCLEIGYRFFQDMWELQYRLTYFPRRKTAAIFCFCSTECRADHCRKVLFSNTRSLASWVRIPHGALCLLLTAICCGEPIPYPRIPNKSLKIRFEKTESLGPQWSLLLTTKSTLMVLYNVRVLDHFWQPIVQCFATEDAVQIVNSFITIPITRNYNHSQLFLNCVTFTELTILHSLQSYTFPILTLVVIQSSQHTWHFTLPVSVSYRDLSRRTTT